MVIIVKIQQETELLLLLLHLDRVVEGPINHRVVQGELVV
jgi:hypothetical protein